jgi:hypothetical protein
VWETHLANAEQSWRASKLQTCWSEKGEAQTALLKNWHPPKSCSSHTSFTPNTHSALAPAHLGLHSHSIGPRLCVREQISTENDEAGIVDRNYKKKTLKPIPREKYLNTFGNFWLLPAIKVILKALDGISISIHI